MSLHGKDNTFGDKVLQFVEFLFCERGIGFDFEMRKLASNTGLIVKFLLIKKLNDLWFFGVLFYTSVEVIDYMKASIPVAPLSSQTSAMTRSDSSSNLKGHSGPLMNCSMAS